ncbi:unnamed protein product [Rotaria socialis]|uniref:Neurotransmitter-gated ion-channel ligand-binding domain-containing protein n=1 Tax=Rotaria socialis TaxID=392032 RepID=A0A817XP81_9BILA|nr:unnamed protein product [Rotaria socialis]CAF4851905.1 unnamed protein product [Rotaria socialis]
MIVNSADASGYLTVNTYSLASVNYSGQVYMILPALAVKTRCNFNVKNFPFDKQMCSINLTSWSQGINRVLYTEDKSLVVDSSEYSEHPLWALNGTDLAIIRTEDRSPFEDTSNDVLAIQLYLEKKPLYFMMSGIFAGLVLNCVTLLAYTLPYGSQIGLCQIFFNIISNFYKQTRVENLDEKADIKVDKVESNTNQPIEVTAIETTTDAKVDETNETTKPKCNFCNRCETYQADFDFDKAKGNTKKDIEARCSALNYFFFSCMLLFMFLSNMNLWLYMSS